MWSAESEPLNAHVQKIRVHWGGAPVTVRAAYELCVGSEPFRTALLAALGGAPFPAYYWETPSVTTATAQRQFEYVITDAPALAAALPDVQAFRDFFGDDKDGDGIVTFDNLGGDATLIVPCPIGEPTLYTHLAAFVRNAPSSQAQSLLSSVGRSVLTQMSTQPTWVSTAGTGVYWLHVRLDSRPKYYRHSQYKRT